MSDTPQNKGIPEITFTAMDQRVTSWTGGYGTHSLTLLTNVGSKTLPLYRCKNVHFWGDSVYTNTPVTGVFIGVRSPLVPALTHRAP